MRVLKEPGADAVLVPSPMAVQPISSGTKIRLPNGLGEIPVKWTMATVLSATSGRAEDNEGGQWDGRSAFFYTLELEEKGRNGARKTQNHVDLEKVEWKFENTRDKRNYEGMRGTVEKMGGMQEVMGAAGWSLEVSAGKVTRSNKAPADEARAAVVPEEEKSPKTVLPAGEEGGGTPVGNPRVPCADSREQAENTPAAGDAEGRTERKRGRPPKSKGEPVANTGAKRGRSASEEGAEQTPIAGRAGNGAQAALFGAAAGVKGRAMNGNGGAPPSGDCQPPQAQDVLGCTLLEDLPVLQLVLRPAVAQTLYKKLSSEYPLGLRLPLEERTILLNKMQRLKQWGEMGGEGDEGMKEAWTDTVMVLHRMRELAGCNMATNETVEKAFPVSREGLSRVREYLKWLEVRLLHWVAYFTQGGPLSVEQGTKIIKIQETFEGSEADIRSEMQSLIRQRKLCMEHLQAENNSWLITCPKIARLLMLSHALLDPDDNEQTGSEEVREARGKNGKFQKAGSGEARKPTKDTAASGQARKVVSGAKRKKLVEEEVWVKRSKFRKLKVVESVPLKKKKGRVGEVATPVVQSKGRKAAAVALHKIAVKKRNMTGSRMCHQCNRVDKPIIFHCQTCQRYRYCAGCIRNRYENLTEADVEEKCPKCRDICNCGHCRDSKNQPRLPPRSFINKKDKRPLRQKESVVENVSTDSGASGPSQSMSHDARA